MPHSAIAHLPEGGLRARAVVSRRMYPVMMSQNKELDIMFDSNRFIVPFQLHGTALNYTTETKATGSGQQGTDGDSDKRETRRQLCCSDISVIYETLSADI